MESESSIEQKFCYGNGQLQEQAFYQDGKREGETLHWYESGELCSSEFYRNGEAEGEFRSWYKNGQTIVRSFHQNGKWEGKRFCWHENGRIWRQHFFHDGSMKGIAKNWSDDGTLTIHRYVRAEHAIEFEFSLKKTIIFRKLKRCLYSRVQFPNIDKFLIRDLRNIVK